MELDVASGKEKTNLGMDVYRQALSAVEEQLLPTGESAQSIIGHACLTHIHKTAHASEGCSPAVVCPNTRQFIIKINVSFPGPSSTCHPNKTEPREVISLLSISLTHSRSARRRGTGVFAVLCHACGTVKIRGKKGV